MVLGLGIGLALGLGEDAVLSITAGICSKKSFIQAGYSERNPKDDKICLKISKIGKGALQDNFSRPLIA